MLVDEFGNVIFGDENFLDNYQSLFGMDIELEIEDVFNVLLLYIILVWMLQLK